MRLSPAFLHRTRQKRPLRIAIVISAILHGAALLWLRFDLPMPSAPAPISPLDVTLITPLAEEEPEVEEESEPIEVEPTAIADAPKQPEQPPAPNGVDPVMPALDVGAMEVTETPSPVDWQNVISAVAKEVTLDKQEQERHRAAMWRKTYSVMFTPPEDWLIEDEPYLPDLQFEADKPKRLGIRISENCYLGFPGIDPQTVDSDAPGWTGGGEPQPTVNVITCGFGD